MKNSNVVDYFRNNKKAKSSNGNLSTDGQKLYSYNMLIGITKNNKKLVLDVMSPNFYSKTTSNHVSLAKNISDEIIKPIPKRIGYGVWYEFPKEYL